MDARRPQCSRWPVGTPRPLPTPVRIDQGGASAPPPAPVSSPGLNATVAPGTGSSPQLQRSVSASAWNAAGTWEERNFTTWAKERLEALVVACTCSVPPDGMVLVTKVKNVHELKMEDPNLVKAFARFQERAPTRGMGPGEARPEGQQGHDARWPDAPEGHGAGGDARPLLDSL